jgi:hypothetical protein
MPIIKDTAQVTVSKVHIPLRLQRDWPGGRQTEMVLGHSFTWRSSEGAAQNVRTFESA